MFQEAQTTTSGLMVLEEKLPQTTTMLLLFFFFDKLEGISRHNERMKTTKRVSRKS